MTLCRLQTKFKSGDAGRDTISRYTYEIIDKKMQGVTTRAPGASAPAANVVNLMDALKRSVRDGATSDRHKPQSNRTPSKKPARSPARARKAG